jgi:hypothetical protein
MTNLFECSRCHKVLVDEEYDEHYCMPKIAKWHSWEPIKIAHFSISEREGKRFIDMRSLDGTKFEFIEVPEDKERTKTPYQPTGNMDNKPTRKQNLFCGSVKSTVDFLSVNSRLM